MYWKYWWFANFLLQIRNFLWLQFTLLDELSRFIYIRRRTTQKNWKQVHFPLKIFHHLTDTNQTQLEPEFRSRIGKWLGNRLLLRTPRRRTFAGKVEALFVPCISCEISRVIAPYICALLLSDEILRFLSNNINNAISSPLESKIYDLFK